MESRDDANHEESFEYNLDLSDPKEFVPATMMNYFGSVKDNLADGLVLSIGHPLMDFPFEIQALNDTLGVLHDLGADQITDLPPMVVKTDDAEPQPTMTSARAKVIMEALSQEVPLVLARLAEIVQEHGIPEHLAAESYTQDVLWCAGLSAWIHTALDLIEESGNPDFIDHGFSVGFADPVQLPFISAITDRRLIAAAEGHL